MRPTRTLTTTLTITLAITLSACNPRTTTPTHTPHHPREHPNIALALAPNARTPILQGAHWTYHHPNHPTPTTLHITHHTNNHASVTHTTPNDRTTYELHTPNRGIDGVHITSIDTNPITPPLTLLPPEQHLSIDAAWAGTHTLTTPTSTITLEHTASILTRQIISTPAGEAIAYQIHHSLTTYAPDRTPTITTLTAWYAPYVGYLTTPNGAVLHHALIRN